MHANKCISFICCGKALLYYKVFDDLETDRQSAQLKEGHAKLPVYLLGSLQHLLPAHPFCFLLASKEQTWTLAWVSLTASLLV